MQSDDSHMTQLVVDGEVLLLPDTIAWRKLLFDPVIDTIPLRQLDSLWHNLAFTHYFAELALSLQRVQIRQLSWLGLVLLRIDDRWQRVHVERLTCGTCGWLGATANAMDTLLYIGAADKWAAFEVGPSIPVLPCPVCRTKLPRHPIWIEPSA